VNLRARLLAVFTLTVVLAVALVAWTVSSFTGRAFQRLDNQRTAALVAEFQQEFTRRAEEVSRRVEGIAHADETLRMAVDLGRTPADYSAHVDDAAGMAAAHQLDFLEVIAEDGTIISSAQWPARFGYKEEWLSEPVDWTAQRAFLKREELADGVALALMAVRPVNVGDKKLFIVGGRKLDREFLASLVLPAGMRALLYQRGEMRDSPEAHDSTPTNPDAAAGSIVDASGPFPQAEKLMPLISQFQHQAAEASATLYWKTDPASAETFHVIPLTGRHQEILGMFLVGSSRGEQAELERHIRFVASIVAGAGILLGVALSGWAASRVTRPVERLAAASQQVADGNWNVRVKVESNDELGQLARAFNQMTQHLVEQRDRLVQSERVAAWRELARRLAHELKNPLFPLQITVENLLRARESDQFDEVFRESTATLLAELANLRTIIGRFSDFAKMPAPQLQTVKINDVVCSALNVFEAQLDAPGQPCVDMEINLDDTLGAIQADPDLLHRAVQNLALNALDAMPAGGKLTVRTQAVTGGVRLEISDSGKGLTKEECERLFTPYYTTKQHGTGLGLAIVQSVVSDHGGKISVESAPERGTKFVIDLPAEGRKPPAAGTEQQGTHPPLPHSSGG